jgi:hypothetical protein
MERRQTRLYCAIQQTPEYRPLFGRVLMRLNPKSRVAVCFGPSYHGDANERVAGGDGTTTGPDEHMLMALATLVAYRNQTCSVKNPIIPCR